MNQRFVITYESLPWEMNPRSLLNGNGPLKVLISDGQEIVIKPWLGPGYWNRAREELNKMSISDIDKILPILE